MKRILHFIYPLFAVLFVTTLLAGCQHHDNIRTFNAMRNDKSITLNVGESVRIFLSINPKASDKWELVQLDQKIVSVRLPAIITCNVPVGGLARMNSCEFMFHGEAVGSTVLKMQALDLDHKEVVDTFTVTFVVNAGPAM